MSMGLDESLRSFLKSILVEVAQQVLPIALSHQQRQSSSTENSTSRESDRLLWRPREAAKALAISERHLWALSNAGKIPYVRLNRLVRYDPVVLREMLRNPDFNHIDIRDPVEPYKKGEPKEPRRSRPRISKLAKLNSGNMRKNAAADEPQGQARKAYRNSPQEQQDSESKMLDVRGYFAERLGVVRDKLPVITMGKIRDITGLDIVALHGWIYKGQELPQQAIDQLKAFFAAAANSSLG
jgi:hypothetical protein